MWAISKHKFSNFLDKVTRTVHLNAEKIATWYAYILFLIPLAFWLMIEMRALAIKQSWGAMIKQPAIAVGVLIAVTDFMVGYYLLLRKKDLLASYKNYRFFMMWQAVTQILVGNLICFVLALLGIHEAKKLEDGPRDLTVTLVSVVSGIMLLICFGFIVLMSL